MNTPHVSVFHDVLLQAISSLKENRLRTVLSVLGIMIGICAVMVVGTVSQGVKKYVYQELDSYGLETLWIYRNWQDENPFRSVRKGTGIDNDDLKFTYSCCPSVKQVSPVVYTNRGPVPMRTKGSFLKVNLEGVGINYIDINNDAILLGRDFREDDIHRKKSVAIIGTKVRDELFGAHVNPIQQVIRWRDVRLTVIGVIEEKNREILSQLGADNYDPNKRVLIPYTLYQQELASNNIGTLQAEAISKDKTDEALKEIIDLLKRRHNYRYEYVGESMDAWIATAEELLRNISLIGLVAALISLLVGGMGISVCVSCPRCGICRLIADSDPLAAHQRLCTGVDRRRLYPFLLERQHPPLGFQLPIPAGNIPDHRFVYHIGRFDTFWSSRTA